MMKKLSEFRSQTAKKGQSKGFAKKGQSKGFGYPTYLGMRHGHLPPQKQSGWALVLSQVVKQVCMCVVFGAQLLAAPVLEKSNAVG